MCVCTCSCIWKNLISVYFQASLSSDAEKALEETIKMNPKGDIIYFWARMDINDGLTGSNAMLTFWSMCDALNGGNCRQVLLVKSILLYDIHFNISSGIVKFGIN